MRLRTAVKFLICLVLAFNILYAGNWVMVKRVIDGDTFETESGARVRLIGVDTPETKHPAKTVEYFGIEAFNYTKQKLEGKKVRLAYDWQKNDRYGRILAYAYLEDSTLFNASLIREGYAHAYIQYPFTETYMEWFTQLETEARENERGLWATNSPANVNTLYCNVGKAAIWSEPNTNSDFLGFLSDGAAINPLEEHEDWYKVKHGEVYGWVIKKYFDEKQAKTDQYWYNSGTGVLHNSGCKWYGNTKEGNYANDELGRDCGICGGAHRIKEEKQARQGKAKYWINSKSNVRHNSSCRWYGNTKKGYYTNEKVGKACGLCGG